MNLDAIKGFLTPEVIWFLVGLVLLIFEFIMPGLIIGFFGVGAWFVAVVCLINDIGLNTQLALFIASSVLSLVFLRQWLKGIFLGHEGSKQDLTLNLDEFIGQRRTSSRDQACHRDHGFPDQGDGNAEQVCPGSARCCHPHGISSGAVSACIRAETFRTGYFLSWKPNCRRTRQALHR